MNRVDLTDESVSNTNITVDAFETDDVFRLAYP